VCANLRQRGLESPGIGGRRPAPSCSMAMADGAPGGSGDFSSLEFKGTRDHGEMGKREKEEENSFESSPTAGDHRVGRNRDRRRRRRSAPRAAAFRWRSDDEDWQRGFGTGWGCGTRARRARRRGTADDGSWWRRPGEAGRRRTAVLQGDGEGGAANAGVRALALYRRVALAWACSPRTLGAAVQVPGGRAGTVTWAATLSQVGLD